MLHTTPLELALRLPKFGMCIVVDICDTLLLLLDIFSLSPPAGPQTKGLVKSLDFPTQLQAQSSRARVVARGFLATSHKSTHPWIS
jgi:hypothetical protein